MSYLQQFNELSLLMKFLFFFILIGVMFLYSFFLYLFSKKFNFKKKTYGISLIASVTIILASSILQLIFSLFFDLGILFYGIITGLIIFVINLFIFKVIYRENWKNSLITLILSSIIIGFILSILLLIANVFAIANLLG